MCLCRRSSGSDTWPDLLHSTRTSREQRPIRTLTHSSRPTSLQVRLQEVFTQCISQVSQAWIPLWQSCNSEKLPTASSHVELAHYCPLWLFRENKQKTKKWLFFWKKKVEKDETLLSRITAFPGTFYFIFFITFLYLFHNECFVIQFRITKSKATKYMKKQTPCNAEFSTIIKYQKRHLSNHNRK